MRLGTVLWYVQSMDMDDVEVERARSRSRCCTAAQPSRQRKRNRCSYNKKVKTCKKKCGKRRTKYWIMV